MKPNSLLLYFSLLLTLFFFSCKETPTNVIENNNSGFIPDDGEALFKKNKKGVQALFENCV